MSLSSSIEAVGHGNLEMLSEDSERVLCRGWRDVGDGGLTAVLVTLSGSEHPTPAFIDRLAHEYALKDQLDGRSAVRPLALVREHGRTMLLLKDPGGEPLDQFLGRPMEIGRFLNFAIGLSVALRHLHERGFIHKDIKPANVLVNATTSQVWLMGFGIASRLPRERQSPEPPEFIAGSFPYMAPEQTGRMNRSVDSRSDLYALGVTLYEMLTGSLPFTAADPMEWVHCHIARQPVPPIDRVADVPAAVSAIVLKLLSKTAEERYQTAAGIEADLRQCLADWESRRRIDMFPLGLRDTPDRLLIPEKLYGRAGEIDILLASFDRVVASGTPELVLVSGYSGIGKSSVVNELHKVLVPPRGLFAAGKFDQYKRDIPYATLAQALRKLVRHILVKSQAEVDHWRSALTEALGPNGQLIVGLVPELEVIIGRQPPVPDLPPRDAHNRFQLVFRRFLGAFAKPEHPLALFLDDLQWLDTATLDLLEHLVTHSEVRHLLLVGAYRDNEVSPSHPLVRTLAAIRKAGARVQEIVLAPLALDDVGKLVADALHCEPERARPLAQLVQEKTGGNPFFAIQFFTALADEGLLRFDPITRVWQWNMDRISAKSYTDNVVDLMAGKLKRLSSTTQEVLKQLACLGNIAEVATLALVHGETKEATHAALLEAVHAGLIFREDSAYKFLHDRIQQAAYSLIPNKQRADVHLRIGRMLLANMTPEQLAEHLFDIANHLNWGAARLIDRDEKTGVAAIHLRAGRKAKASTAYASACAYLAAGTALLGESDWTSQYELMFSLWLERAECELLTGDFDMADQLIGMLLLRAASNVEFAAASCLKVQLHVVKGEYPEAVDSALTGLRLFGIDIPAHPTLEQVQAEYESLWRILDGRPIESLIDLPMMTDPELQAAMQVLSAFASPAYFTDFHLFCLFACRMVRISIQHGMSGACAHGCSVVGFVLGPVFHRYSEGYRFVKLACDLVEKHGFIAHHAKVNYAMGTVAFWTQPIGTAIASMQATFRGAIETGDLTFACYGVFQSVTGLLLQNDPLDAVWRESEMALDFARETKYGDSVNIIRSQQRFIATMQGRTGTFSTFSDAQFDEATFEAQMTGDRMPLMICWYWILKLKARFLSGDYVAALAAADKAKPLLSKAAAQIQLLDYFYYTALTVAALYEGTSKDEQNWWRELLTAHREQLREWAENYPPTFADKHALVLAEIARIDGRAFDAMESYEQAIQSAHENGFVQNEGLAHELAARFYTARGFETIAHAYLRNARSCYLLWGADAVVRQLDRLHPRLAAAEGHRSTATVGSPVQQLDVASVVKASQAVSSEIELPKLIERLMTIALQNAGADRGLLILPAEDDHFIQAEAQATGNQVEVELCQKPITGITCPESLVRYVIRTHESVILDDATRPHFFSEDGYLRYRQAKSILCLPLIKQGRLTGLLYLENTLTSHAFTPDRIAVLELLAAQAAISLENTRLYSDLQEREAKVRRLVDSNIIGIFIWDFEGRIIEANEAFLHMMGHSRDDLVSGRMRWSELTPAEWGVADERTVAELKATCVCKSYEKEFFRKDGSRVPVLVGAATFDKRRDQGVAFVLDLSERKGAEAALRESESYLAEAQRLSHTGSCAWTPAAGKIRYWSEECFRILGFDPAKEPPPFEAILQRIHPDDQARVMELIERAPRDRADFTLDCRVIHPDSRIRDLHLVSHPVLNAFDDLVEFVGTVIDVTERKRADEERQNHLWFLESMDKVNRAIQGTNDLEQMTRDVLDAVLSIFACDRAWLVYPCDPEASSWRAVMEHTRPDYPGAFALGRDLPMDAEVANVFQTARASSRAVQFGAELDRPVPTQLAERFSIKSLIAIAVHPKVDQPYLFGLHQCSYPRIWTAREERLFQEAGRRLGDGLSGLLMLRNLQENEGKLDEAQRIAHVGYWERDLDTNFVTWSDESFRIFGLAPGDGRLAFTRYQELIYPEDRQRVVAAVAEALRGGPRYDVEYRVLRPNGEVRIVYSRGDVMRDESGRPRRMFGIVQDVTERKRAEEDLRESERRYRETQVELAHVNRVTTMGQLTASIAHEVNQPIAAAVTSAGAGLRWLAAEPPNIEKGRDSFDRIIKAGNQASEVIGRIRGLIKKVPAQRVTLDVNEMILETIALTRSEMQRHCISLQTELAKDLPCILGDRVQLQQVMLNLIMNAIEAMSDVRDDTRELVIGSNADAPDGVIVTVRDSGPGLKPESIDHIFDPFYTTKPTGMGMGLSICRSIAEAHGGRLWASANAPRGARFQFTLHQDDAS
jgi:PAS domain S-box-containing protein